MLRKIAVYLLLVGLLAFAHSTMVPARAVAATDTDPGGGCSGATETYYDPDFHRYQGISGVYGAFLQVYTTVDLCTNKILHVQAYGGTEGFCSTATSQIDRGLINNSLGYAHGAFSFNSCNQGMTTKWIHAEIQATSGRPRVIFTHNFGANG